MIHRKIVKIATEGSRKEGNLRPALARIRGVNMKVLEYSEDDKTAVVELWGSDHESLVPEEQCNMAKINQMPNILEVLPSHAKSPKIIGSQMISIERLKHDKAAIDEKEKTITFKGKKLGFQKKTDRDYVWEEG